jgi:tetratricopeptide (TPR) repeat protein
MDQFTAHLDRGWDLVSRGDFTGALVSARKGVELDGESPEAHNLLGYVHQAEGRADDALEHYRQALSLDDTYVEAMLNAAEVLIHPLADYDGAATMIDDVLELAENSDEQADALLLKFDSLMHQGDREAAERVVRALPDGPYTNPSLDFLVGRALFETGDSEAAFQHLETATSRDAGNPDAHYYQALCREAKGDLQGATASFLRCREAELALPTPPWSLSAPQFERVVQQAVKRLTEPLSSSLDNALVIVSDLPGPEVVADGVDPHLGVLLEELLDAEGHRAEPEHTPVRAGRVFVYQRNIERASQGVLTIEDELVAMLERELCLTFPQLAPEGFRPEPEPDPS